MKLRNLMAATVMLGLSGTAIADLEPWEDYDMSDAIYSVSTIRVDPNMDDAYLEGIKQTWAAANKVQKELGHIEDYAIYRSISPQSGDFNLLLVVKFANTADLAPNKERYDAFVEAMGREQLDDSTDYSQANYPGMRTITGEYLMREITLK